jgi:hypothetical protein
MVGASGGSVFRPSATIETEPLIAETVRPLDRSIREVTAAQTGSKAPPAR